MPLHCLPPRKDPRRQGRDWLALLLWIGIPLIVGGFRGVVMGGIDKCRPRIRVLVADQDGGRIAWLLSKSLRPTSGSGGNYLHVEPVTQAEGRARIDRGDGTALFRHPLKDFWSPFWTTSPQP